MLMFVLSHAKGWASDKDMTPGMIPLGPFDLLPLLRVQESYSDNIFHNNLNRKSSLITQIAAGGELALRRNLDRYALRYSFLSSQYHNSPADNFVDHFLEANTHFDFTRRNRLDLTAGYTRAHNMRGTYFSQGNIATLLDGPDQFHQYTADLDYRYGRVDARGNLGLQIGWTRQIYDNHRERTQFFDRSDLVMTPGFYLRVMPKTYLTAQVETTLVDYDEESDGTQSGVSVSGPFFFGMDYTTYRYLLGATWDQSTKTKGTVRFGYLQQDFTHSDIQGASGLTWDGQLSWSPLTYSTLQLSFSRDIQPSIGSGFSRKVQFYRAGWIHQWPGRVKTQLDGSYQEASGQGTTQDTSGTSFNADVSYAMKPWLNIGLNYYYSDFQYQTNDSNSTQNIFMLYVSASPSGERPTFFNLR